MQYKQVNHQVFVYRGTTQKCFPVDESLLLLIYQVKMASSLWQAAREQLNMKYHSKRLVSNICHIEINICMRKFTIVSILGEIPYQET